MTLTDLEVSNEGHVFRWTVFRVSHFDSRPLFALPWVTLKGHITVCFIFNGLHLENGVIAHIITINHIRSHPQGFV